MELIGIISASLIPAIIILTIAVGLMKRVDIYSAFVSGAKDALKTVYNIFPAVSALMIAIGIFRSSGLLQFAESVFSPFLNIFDIPKEILPMALLRPLSGSGGLAILTDIIKECGADSKAGVIASVICGSTETTFYTVAVYFGAVGISNTRHTIRCALIADAVCVISGILICSLLLF